MWSWSPTEGHQPLLLDPVYAYVSFSTDGTNAVWVRGKDRVGPNSYAEVELWTAPLEFPGPLTPKFLATTPHQEAPGTSVGDGWVAAYVAPNDVRLHRLSDGTEKRLPPPPSDGWTWRTQYATGMPMADGAVWVRAAQGTQTRYLTRFAINALPPP